MGVVDRFTEMVKYYSTTLKKNIHPIVYHQAIVFKRPPDEPPAPDK